MKTIEQQKTIMRTERAIKFLEQRAYKLAEKEVDLILRDSDNMQSRMAAMAIEYVCARKDDLVTEDFLETVTDITTEEERQAEEAREIEKMMKGDN